MTFIVLQQVLKAKRLKAKFNYKTVCPILRSSAGWEFL
jgi:hypothetical protein